MTLRVLRAWVVAGMGLAVASAGLQSLLVTGSITSLTRSAVAAAILSAYAAVVGIITTPRPERTRLGCLVYGGVVPVAVLVVTLVLVWSRAGAPAGLLAAAPWLAGPAAAAGLGPLLPSLRFPRWRRRER